MDMNSIHRIPDPRCGHFPATPLWYAYTRGRNETIYTYLLKNGADPNHCMFAIAWYDDPKAAALFKKHGAKISDNEGKDTPFLAAIGWKKFEVARWFLENGANVNAADEKGNSALFIAVKRKYDLDIIEMLLKFDHNPDQENNKGISPRKLAASYRRKDIINLILPRSPSCKTEAARKPSLSPSLRSGLVQASDMIFMSLIF